MGNGTFTATASYSGRATGSKVTGYTSKAIYSGEVSKETLDSCTYKVIYEGAPIPAPYLQYGLTAGSVLALLIILAVLWNRRKNAKKKRKRSPKNKGELVAPPRPGVAAPDHGPIRESRPPYRVSAIPV